MTVAAGDGHEYPIYAGRFRITFPVFDADGDLVTGMSTPDSEVSIDGGNFADCTNEATEIQSTGIYRLDLTAAEMTGKTIVVNVKSATSGMKPTVFVLNPKRPDVVESGTAQAGAGSTITLASGASAKDSFYVGKWVRCSNNSPSNVQGQTRKIISYVGSTKVATVEAAWGTNPSSATTYDILAPGDPANTAVWAGKRVADVSVDGVPEVDVTHFGGSAGTFASGRPEVNTTLIEGSDATNQIRDSIVDDATRIDASALNTLSGHDPGETIMGATDLGTGSGLTSLASASALSTVAGYLDTEVAAILADTNELQTDWVNGGRLDLLIDAIKAATDNLPSDPADASVVAGLIAGVDAKIDTIDSNVDAILVDTAEIGSAGAGLTALATQSSVNTIDSNVDAIKAKTDSLNFGVTGKVDSNITHVNEVEVTGDGDGTPWGPA